MDKKDQFEILKQFLTSNRTKLRHRIVEAVLKLWWQFNQTETTCFFPFFPGDLTWISFQNNSVKWQMELIDQPGESQAAISILVRTITQGNPQRNETHGLYSTTLVIYVLSDLWQESEHKFVFTYKQSPFKPMTFTKRRKTAKYNGSLMGNWWCFEGQICAHQWQV